MQRSQRKWLAGLIVPLVFAAIFVVRGFTQPMNDFHFALIGDRTGDVQPQIFGRVWREVDLLHPDFVLNVGDTIQGGNDATAEKEWSELRPLFQRYKHYPLYFTPGNHDIWSDFSRRLYEKESGRASFYGFDYQNMHFTILDNSRTAALTDEQLAFLEEDLKANSAKQPKLVVFHRPFWIDAIRTQGTEFPLHKLAKKYGVEHIISGHGHTFVHRVFDGVRYMEVGSSGGGMRGKLLRGESFPTGVFYHWVWAHVQGGKVLFTVKEIQGPMGLGRMFKADDWTDSGPQFDVSDPGLREKPQT